MLESRLLNSVLPPVIVLFSTCLILFYVGGPGHITPENGRTRVPVCRRVVNGFFPLFSPQVTDAGCLQQFPAVHRLLPCRARPHHLGERTHQGPCQSPRRHWIFSAFDPTFFCQNIFISQPNRIYGIKTAKLIEICKVLSLSTSHSFCQRTTV